MRTVTITREEAEKLWPAKEAGPDAPVVIGRPSLTAYRDHPKARKHQKYRNKVLETEDGRFDSEAEYRHWCHLKIRQRVGEQLPTVPQP